MKPVNGIFDGKRVHLLEKVKGNKKSKVTVNFGDELSEEEIASQIVDYTQSDAFDFWHSSEEDIYQDYLKKRKKWSGKNHRINEGNHMVIIPEIAFFD